MVIVGAYARIDASKASAVIEGLELLDGVETFALEDEGKLGLVIEGTDLAAAHGRLDRDVRAVQGVLCVWPVYVHHDPDQGSDGKD